MARKVILLLTFLTLLIPAKAENHKVIAEEVIAIVGNSAVMLSELEMAMDNLIQDRKEKGIFSGRSPKDEALEGLLTNKLMAAQASADSLDKTLNIDLFTIESYISGMIEGAGSVKQLEKLMGKPIYQIKADLQEVFKENERASIMRKHVTEKVTITYDEVKEFFDGTPKDSMQMIPDQYTYAQIVRKPTATKEKGMLIREKLLEYRRRILEGESFSVLARLYSQDIATANNGGEFPARSPEEFQAPYAEAAELLKPGQISEIVQTEDGFHIIELISAEGGKLHTRHIMLRPQFSGEEMIRAERELDSVANEIRQGNLSFERAVPEHSDDKATKENDGIVFNLRPYKLAGNDIKFATIKFETEQLDRYDYPSLSRLGEGEVSDSFEAKDENDNLVYKIVKLVKFYPSHFANLDEDYSIIETIALTVKQMEVLNEWIDETIQKMYVYIAPDYRNTEFTRKGWLNKVPLLPY